LIFIEIRFQKANIYLYFFLFSNYMNTKSFMGSMTFFFAVIALLVATVLFTAKAEASHHYEPAPECWIGTDPEHISHGEGTTLWWWTQGAQYGEWHQGYSEDYYGPEGHDWIYPDHTTTYKLKVWDDYGNEDWCETTVYVEDKPELDNIVEIAQDTDELSILVQAVVAADLVDTLSGSGPFTVFAPLNSAFEALPGDTLSNLLLPENKNDLIDILTYHVVAGEFSSHDLYNGQTLTTVNGNKVKIKIPSPGSITVNDSNVVIGDIFAENGVVHVIDAVLIPQDAPQCTHGYYWDDHEGVCMPEVHPECWIGTDPEHISHGEGTTLWWWTQGAQYGEWHQGYSEDYYGPEGHDWIYPDHTTTYKLKVWDDYGNEDWCETTVYVEDKPELDNIVEIAQDTDELSILVQAVVAADLVDTLSGSGPFTVFAPLNSAFEALPGDTLSNLLLPENKNDLIDILTYHVVAGEFSSHDLYNGQTLTTVNGNKVKIKIPSPGSITVNDSNVVIGDIFAENGVVHVIDAVLIPQDAPQCTHGYYWDDHEGVCMPEVHPECWIGTDPEHISHGEGTTLWWWTQGAQYGEWHQGYSEDYYGPEGHDWIYPDHTTTYKLKVWDDYGNKDWCETTVYVESK
jgi:uncharacterized surface protein with fasciclin (FAS1) repeats